MALADTQLPGRCNPEAVYGARDTLLEMYAKPPWSKDGLCRKYPNVDFVPRRGRSTALPKSICALCIVRRESLAWAVEHDEVGIWGGTTAPERRRLV